MDDYVPHKQTARSGVTPKRAEVFRPKERLVSQLRHDVVRFVDFAIRTLRHKSGVGSSVEPQRSRRHHPRFHEHIGVFDGDFVKDFIALTREFLHDVHVGGMEEAASSEPRRIDKRDGVEHQRVALPAPHGISHVGGLDRLLWVVLAAVGWDHAKFPVSASVIACRIQHGNVVRRLEDAAGRALPRKPHRLARHDRIVLVRPLIEFLNLVPKLGFVNGTTQNAKPRGRDPLIIHPEVVLPGFCSARYLRWTTSAGSTTRDWIRRRPPQVPVMSGFPLASRGVTTAAVCVAARCVGLSESSWEADSLA